MDKIKVHARVTREIEVTIAEANILIGLAIGSLDESEEKAAEAILSRFTDGINSGSYEKGYVPSTWLEADLNIKSNSFSDIEL